MKGVDKVPQGAQKSDFSSFNGILYICRQEECNYFFGTCQDESCLKKIFREFIALEDAQ